MEYKLFLFIKMMPNILY